MHLSLQNALPIKKFQWAQIRMISHPSTKTYSSRRQLILLSEFLKKKRGIQNGNDHSTLSFFFFMKDFLRPAIFLETIQLKSYSCKIIGGLYLE